MYPLFQSRRFFYETLRLFSRVLLLSVTAFAASAESFDWPQWQGPDRNAISKETGLLKEWPKDGPPLAWKIKGLGGGDSAPSIAAGRIFGMSNRGENEVVWALSEKDGKEIWATRLGPAFRAGTPRREERGRRARRRSMANGSMSRAWAAMWLACRSKTARSSGEAA